MYTWCIAEHSGWVGVGVGLGEVKDERAKRWLGEKRWRRERKFKWRKWKRSTERKRWRKWKWKTSKRNDWALYQEHDEKRRSGDHVLYVL
jgi:hypothetical protein